MKYHGYLLQESLADTTVLEKLTITTTETYPCPEHMKADYMDDVWTGIAFEEEQEDAEKIAHMLSQAVKQQGWFIEMDTDDNMNYLIFPGKVVKYPREHHTNKPWPAKAVELAKNIDVPAFVE
jgi:hypothetical protein